MGLREVEASLPPGFRFFPSDEELISHYLSKKVMANEGSHDYGSMVEVDLHSCEPWELPEVAKMSENEWYFFNFRDRKYSTGPRTNRATKIGYWKATGKDRAVNDPHSHLIVGMRKTLVFYCGRAPNGMKTNWVMHEFRLMTPQSLPKEDWVLCRVFCKKKGEVMSHKELSDNTMLPSSAASAAASRVNPGEILYDDQQYQQMLEHDDDDEILLNGGSALMSSNMVMITSCKYQEDDHTSNYYTNSTRNNNTCLNMQYHCNLDANDFPQESAMGPNYDERYCGHRDRDQHHDYHDVISLEEIGLMQGEGLCNLFF